MEDGLLETRRLLIIDDDPVIHAAIRAVVREIVDYEGPLDIDAVESGEEGVEATKQAVREGRPYAIALVDLRLSGEMNGLQATSQLWRADAELQTILCSAHFEDLLAEMPPYLRTSDRLLLLRKPFDPDIVRQMIRSLLTKWELSGQVRRQIEELAREAIRIRTIIETANDAYFSLDQNGRVADCSEQALQMLGCSRFTLSDRRAADFLLLKPGDYRSFEELLAHVKQTNQGLRTEMTVRRNDSTELPVEVSIAPMGTERSWSFNVFVHDVSQQRRLQAQLMQADRMRSIGHLAAGVAHEINTPVQFLGDNLRFLQNAFDDLRRTIQSDDEWAKTAPLSETDRAEWVARRERHGIDDLFYEVPSAIQESLDGIGRVGNIVRAMKSFSHVTATERCQNDLATVVENTLAICRAEWQGVADVVAEIAPELPPVPCVRATVQQALLNIIVNAAQAIGERFPPGSGEKGLIKIAMRREQGCVVVEVQDNGIGIPPENHGRIFDAFFSTKPVGSGMGQGLTTAHAVIVEAHQGQIEVESAVGQGATFRVRLPVQDPLELARRSEVVTEQPTVHAAT